MKCPNCGKELTSSSNFCIYCGTQLTNQQGTLANYNQYSINQKLINQMQQSLEPTTLAYDYYNLASIEKNKCNKSIKYFSPINDFLGINNLILRFLIDVFTLFLILIATGYMIYLSVVLPLNGFHKLLPLLIYIILIYGGLFFLHSVFKKSSIKKYDKYTSIGDKIMLDNEAIMSDIPFQYRNPLALDYCLLMIRQNRASSRNELFTLCDNYLHQCRMEQSMNAQIILQQEQLERLNDIYAKLY